ncbi:alpha-1,2-mannosidase [Melissococcus plutonius ATCC 35311]|uniref:Alpha-1,2-mannosidase n=1 Tax=Melissococcus plutonius (strain ATCC 35311 / DSM 29964 / CIP 104052 / LMG 20360 / NCIMB 702443) TaxID=940190 RepID=F3Y905_MELPT|nr:putative alpha-1,2-mannosidase [Melissococcus plutonius]BAK20983.1 alpha-1,2-mannosidase [Melissococcus plutonius ATCC 35311]
MRTTEIDTRQGTDNQHSFSSGNCLPYTGVPFDMNYFVPQTASDRGNWWFNPRDHTFQGFRLTHQPSPWMGDFSHFTLLPVNGEFTNPTLFDGQSSYRSNESDFKPHYMKIKALRCQLTATMIPSMYGGMLSIDYQQTKAGLLLHLPGNFQLTQEDAFTLSGQISNYTECEDKEFTFYFVLHFQFPAKISSEKTRIGKDETILFSFSDIDQQVIRIGTSYIHLEQAKLNLTRELDWQKIDYLENGQKKWEDYLTRIDIEDKDREKQQTFYHNLYRAFLFSQTFYELDQEENPIHYDTLAKEIKAGKLFTNNGFWDTCRTVYPLYSLIAQEKYEEFLEGFLTSYKESGYLPKWLSPDERGTMPGTLIDAVIADAAIKNIRSDLMPEFLDAMLKGATIESKKKIMDDKELRHTRMMVMFLPPIMNPSTKH